MSMIDISDQEMRHMTDEELRQNKDALRRSPTRNVANNIIGRIIDEQLRRATLRGGRPSMNKTPDTLRALTFIVANGDVRESISAHVAAWEADIARREALERLYSQSRLFFVAKRVLEGALDLGDLRIAVEEHEALHNGR